MKRDVVKRDVVKRDVVRRVGVRCPARAVALRALVALALLASGAAASASGWSGGAAAERTFEALVELFRGEYWDPDHVDWDAWAGEHRERVLAAESRDAFDAAMGRMVRALADDHSVWSGVPANGRAVEGDDEELRLPDPPQRLGVQFGFVAERGLVVQRVYGGTPAARAGLLRGDVIASVGGVELGASDGLRDAAAVLAEALASDGPVALGVVRRRAEFVIEVAPEPVAFAEAASAPYAALLDPSTGYLAVPTFNVAGVGEAAHARMRELQRDGAVNLVLDLRGNLGGRLVEVGLLLGAFLDGDWTEAIARDRVAWHGRFDREAGGGVARLVGDDDVVLAEARIEDAVRWRGRVVAIVGAENASAGEIAALALQDHGVAVVVGERTAGNVEAIRGFELPDGSRVLIAVADLRGAHGLDFGAGVVPDVAARATVADLARGVDSAVAEARRVLGALPFTPDRHF